MNLPFGSAVKDPTQIRWRFGEVSSLQRPPIVLEKLPVCGNCHSFSKSGRVLGMDSEGNYQVIKAQAPMAEVLRYALDLNSITAGRGSFKMEHSHYEEVPAQLAEKVIAEAKET